MIGHTRRSVRWFDNVGLKSFPVSRSLLNCSRVIRFPPTYHPSSLFTQLAIISPTKCWRTWRIEKDTPTQWPKLIHAALNIHHLWFYFTHCRRSRYEWATLHHPAFWSDSRALFTVLSRFVIGFSRPLQPVLKCCQSCTGCCLGELSVHYSPKSGQDLISFVRHSITVWHLNMKFVCLAPWVVWTSRLSCLS